MQTVLFIQSFILGLIQGIAEFFPVSSSAHLKFARFLLDIQDNGSWLYFDLVCHAGTWLALVYFLRKDIFKVLTSIQKIAQFTIALIPLVPAYFLLKPLRIALSDPSYTGYFLLVTSALLFCASLVTKENTRPGKWGNVLFIGVMQALALLPGISRSGSTIAAARFCGWSWVDGARFSFLLAVPTIFGGELLESYKLLRDGPASIDLSSCAVGFITSFAIGLIAVRYVFWFYERNWVRPFAWYCLGMGILMIVVMHG
jgi:undecaprenyl-diphosphatase